MDEQPVHHEPTDGGGSDPHQQRKEYRQAPCHIDGRILDAQHQHDSRIADRNADTIKTIFRGSAQRRSEEHTSELQSLMRISYAVFCLKKKKQAQPHSPKTNKKNNT